MDEFAQFLGNELDKINYQLEYMGWEEISDELQDELDRDREEAKKRIENSSKK